MAVTSSSGLGAPEREPPRAAEPARPVWVTVVVYLAGLVLLFVGERVLSGYETARYLLSGLGTLAVAAMTVYRFALAARGDGARAGVEKRLALCCLGGLLAIAGYFATTQAGTELLGIASRAPDVRARFDGIVTVGFISLLVASVVPLLFGEAALAPMRHSERPEARRVSHAIAGGLTVAFAAIYGSLFAYGAGELEMKADFSYFRTAKASDSTRKIAAGIQDELVALTFFPPVNEVGAEVEGYLAELANQTENLKVEHHDRLLVPAVAKDNRVTQDGVIVFKRGDASERVVVGDDMKAAAPKLKTLDQDVQKALLKLLRTKRTAYLTIGHGELNEPSSVREKEGRSAKYMREILESQNYTVKDLGVGQGLATEIPDDAGIVMVIGPDNPLLPESVEALKRYAERGGKLLMALDPEGGANNDALAGIVGLSTRNVRLANDQTYLKRRHNESDRGNLLVTGDARRGGGYSSHASVSTLSKGGARAGLIFAGAAPLEKLEGYAGKVDFVIRSSRTEFIDENGDFELQADTEKRGIHNLAAAVSLAATAAPGAEGQPGAEPGADETRAFVLGDADVLSDAALHASDWNKVLFLDAVRWLGGEESFAGELSTTEDVRIEHTKEEDAVWFYSSIIAAPALVFGIGMWRTRRRQKTTSKSRDTAKKPRPAAKKPSREGAR